MAETTTDPTPARPAASRPALVAAGIALFLFIPLVLYRFLARPYMRRALAGKCLWCNRVLPPAGAAEPAETLEIGAGSGTWTARFCPGHRAPAARFLSFAESAAWPLRMGIFVPLLALLA